MTETTEDDFLGGRLRLRQPVDGYRAGIDPVLLAASVPARAGDTVLELGTGSGTALLCLMARVPGISATGVERHPGMAALARQNVAANGFAATIVEADLAHLPPDLRDAGFDHVLANPPFFDRARGSAAKTGSREAGRGQETPVAVWIDTAVRRLRPGGRLSLIQRAERLPEVVSCLHGRVGDIVVLPLQPRRGREAKLFILQAKKGAKGAFRLLAAFVLHAGDAHLADGDDYTAEAAEILRRGAPLDVQGLMNR